jgi:hypothetical protein
MTRRRGRPNKTIAAERFWGSASEEHEAPKPIHPTPDPAALLQSLGEPPLLPQATAHNTLAVVYSEAVRAATALAAANGLLDPDSPVAG